MGERRGHRGAGRAAVCAVGVVTFLLALPGAAPADSLYGGPGPRPGPDILYSEPATAPQLEYDAPWQARPILISGASAYRQGEFLYQDFLYDDHGARGEARDPNDPRTSGDQFSAPNGTYTYPNDPAYAGNGADLVELRVRPRAASTAFLITLNTLEKPGLVATTIAIGESAEPREFPHGANASAPAELFLTVHGQQAELLSAADGGRVGPAPSVEVSKRRNQFTVQVPHAAWDPGEGTVRLAAGVGLWDSASDSYLLPQSASDADHGGGAFGLTNPTAFYNVAFRFDEPWPDVTEAGGLGSITDPAWWRDKQQGHALADHDLSPFYAEVDFAKLEAGARDDMADQHGGVPTHGPIDRILSSHFRTGEGTDYSATCGSATDCVGELRGRLQPYAIYVPSSNPPEGGYGLTLLLHSLAANYNQFSSSNNQSQLGDRGKGSIVITPAGRGPDGWYYGHAGADTFEVWADVARRYDLDSDWTAISGYSMGGYGTFKFATQFPDLFARANPVVGPPAVGIWVPPAAPTGGAQSNTNRMLGSVRNVPFLIWSGSTDELVPLVSQVAQAQTFDDLGYRYVHDVFTPADHFALAVNDEYGPAAKFLGKAQVQRNPAHVTYTVNPTMDFANVDTVADHAYWLSNLELRDGSGSAPLGKVDAFSHGFGRSDPPVEATQVGGGVLKGGTFPALTYTERSKGWGQAAPAAPEDRLELELENVANVRVHTGRARLGCDAQLDVTTDGPVDVTLAGCARTLSFGG